MRDAIRSGFFFVIACLCAGQASAFALSMTGANGQLVSVGDQVTVTVSIDTEGESGLALLSTAVLFDDEILSYNEAASWSSSYLLFAPYTGPGSMGGVMMPKWNAQSLGLAPQLRYGTTDQVNVDFVSDALIHAGNPASGTTWAFDQQLNAYGTFGQLGALVFDVVAEGDGVADIGLSITSPGNIVAVVYYHSRTATLYGAGTVIVPEPSPGALWGAGLVALGLAASIRSRRLGSGLR